MLDLDPRTGEEVRVEAWRLQRFLEMGMRPVATAELLARSHVDLHEFEELRQAGCEAQLAALILL